MSVTMKREAYTTTTRGLNRDLPPMILFEKAKKLGIWNPADIDFSQDTKDWKNLNPVQQEYILTLSSQFIAGEEAVTLDLLPLMKTIADSGYLEEELYLTTFLWEEAKHVDFFQRTIDSWDVSRENIAVHQLPSYMNFFGDTFTRRMNILYDDPSPENLLRASATYNLSIEGVIAETGYYAWYQIMETANILPGARQGIRNLQLDESRHIAFGVWLCSRLVAEHPDLYDIIPEVIEEGFSYIQKLLEEIQEKVGELPFDYSYDDVIMFAMGQFQKRIARIEKSRGKSLKELYGNGAELILED